VYTNKTNELF